MQPIVDFDPVSVTRSLLRRSRQGALATLVAKTGSPYCSLVAVASHPDASPLLLISRLALHTQNILADNRVSLMLDERAPGDPLQGARIMLSGRAVAASDDDKPLLRRRYLAAHPSAEMFVDFTDFGFFRVALDSIHLVAGFGRIVDLEPDNVLTNLSGADKLIEAEDGAIEHMNTDHSDAIGLYATRLLKAPASDWRCTGLDPDGLDLTDGDAILRLNFPRRIATPGDLRKILVELAAQARAVPEE